MRNVSLLSMWVVFHHHLLFLGPSVQWGPGKQGWWHLNSLFGLYVGTVLSSWARQISQLGYSHNSSAWFWSKDSQVHIELSSKLQSTRPFVTTSRKVWIWADIWSFSCNPGQSFGNVMRVPRPHCFSYKLTSPQYFKGISPEYFSSKSFPITRKSILSFGQ